MAALRHKQPFHNRSFCELATVANVRFAPWTARKAESQADFIICMCEFDFRQAQVRSHGDCQISRGSNENGTEAASLIVAVSGCA
jgi:hypothetical protein